MHCDCTEWHGFSFRLLCSAIYDRTYTYPDGGRYEGAWEDGLEHGEGVFIAADGTRSHDEGAMGRWFKGRPEGMAEEDDYSDEPNDAADGTASAMDWEAWLG